MSRRIRRTAPAGAGGGAGRAGATVVVTKVLLPSRRKGIVPRRRLLDFLHRYLDRRLQLVIAPPGYGKTTLLVNFAHEALEQSVPVCWLTLDAADADARSFFEHLVLSIRQQFPAFGQRTAALLGGVEDAAREYRAIATALANEVAEQIDEFFVLVLDDYQAVGTSPAVHGAVDWLIQRLPEGCRIILGGRVIPTQLNLSTLAARLDVAGLGIADLRFRSDEAADLIRMHGGYGVHPREADRAVNRAEGWVTAILLSLHAEETARFSGLLRAKSRHEPVYDYLATQVFDRLPDERRQFLMESAVLPTMAAAECDAVLERADSGEQLAGLVQMGLFVEPLEPADPGAVSAAAGEGIDQEAATEEAATEEAATGEWLRYHQLWRAFLLARLAAQDAARLRQLRRRAAERAVQRGQPEVAVEHLLESGVACGDWEEAVALVLKLAEQELASGRAARLLAWIERIPPAVADAQPLLLVHSARALRRMGRNRDSLERAEQAEQTASGARQWDVVYLARAWRAEMLAFLGRGDEAVALLVDLFDQVNRQPRPGDLRIRLEKEACITLTVAGRYKEALNHGAAALSGLRSIRSKAERLHLAANVHNMHGICHARLGAAAEAEAHYRRAERLWKQLGNVTNQAGILNGLALLRQQAGQAGEAEAFFRRGIDLAERIGHLGIQVVLRNNLARCQRERGALTDARETIERSLSLARQIDEGLELGEALQEAGLVALRLGQVLEAIRSLEAAQDVAEECWPTGLALSQALLTLAYARTGRWLEAQQLAARARRSEAQTRSPEGRLRASVALVAASAALHPDNPDLSELRGARRWARDHDLLASFFVECAQYRETARLLLGERRLPGGVMARLQAVLDGEAAAVSGSAPEQPVLRAVPRATPDAEFQIRLLGTPTLLRDGQVVASWRTNLVKDLLFFLALRAGTTVRSEAIVDSLLPDAEYERSLTALRHAVYHLRRLFAPLNPVRTVAGGYCLDLEPGVYCDVHEFRHLIEQGRPARGESDVAALEAAVRHYRGALLEGLDADWVLQSRAELEGQFLIAAQLLLAAYESADRHASALAVAQRVLAVDPFHEQFHLATLRHQVALGQVTAARQHYRHYCRLMRDTFGRGPAPEATNLLPASGPAIHQTYV